MKENINCISYPFKEGDEPAFPTVYLHEGPMLAEDIPMDENVVVRNLEFRDLMEISGGSLPSGGFLIKKWLSKEDGVEKLQHYHVEFMPQFDDEAKSFIDNRLRQYERAERIGKAHVLSEELPRVRICPDNGIALVNSDKPFMMIDGEGTIMHNKTRHLSLWPDRENGLPYFRFGVYTSDIIDSSTEEEYRIIASGAIIAEGQEALKKRLDLLMANNELTQRTLAEIARLTVSISPK